MKHFPRAARREADKVRKEIIEECHGILTGTYGDDYLDRLDDMRRALDCYYYGPCEQCKAKEHEDG